MKKFKNKKMYACGLVALLLSVSVGFSQNFSLDTLENTSLINPTSLQFGPDDKLYVVQQNGAIKIITVMFVNNGYKAVQTETVNLIRQIPNHYDNDGSAKPYNINTNKRQVTGILVTGTSSDPLIYIASSDPEIGAGSYGDKNLCTNSGVLSKLYKENGIWKKIDLVRGLPRSEENHAPNGMQIYNNKLYLNIGGFTNSGGVSTAWTYITEYALSACMLEINLATIEAMPTKSDATGNHPYKYDLPTLDDPTRPNNPDGSDINDPWGGNDGMNQPLLQNGTPVRIYAAGLRNAYDLVITKTPGRENKMFTIDNAPNRNWGGWPLKDGNGLATNEYDPNETGTTTVVNNDGFKFIGNVTTYNPETNLFYGGHPCPIRANPAGAGLYSDNGTHRGWRNDNSNPNLPLPSNWPPVKIPGNPVESNYYPEGSAGSQSSICFPTSTNGLCEYTASGTMQGDLLTVDYGGNIFRIKLDDNGNVLNNKSADKLNLDAPIATGFGKNPLDITAQGDNDIFPGTIWVAVWGSSNIVVLKPIAAPCTGVDNSSLDEDNDKYSNADEIDNGTNPCSASSKPDDNDNDFISDLNDPDDDNDGIPDLSDCFSIDEHNGMSTTLPTHYHLFNYDPGFGFFGLGFTGLMINGTTDYLELYDKSNLVAGGAAGAFTVEHVDGGDALSSLNNQKNAFQFGAKVAGEGVFVVQSALLPSYFDLTPKDFQSQGIYIGTGDQNNYLKLVLASNGGAGGIEVVQELNGTIDYQQMYNLNQSMPTGPVRLFIVVDPSNAKAFLKYCINNKDTITLGSPVTLKGKILDAVTDPNQSLAIGVIATSRGTASYSATWDYMEAFQTTITSINEWKDGLGAKIHIFPNPGKDKIKIQVETETPKTYLLKIYNNMGTLMQETEMSWSNFSENELLLSHLLPGVYHLQFIDEKEARTASVKFIKE